MFSCLCRLVARLQPSISQSCASVRTSSYKSSLTLDKLYPKSDTNSMTQKGTKPVAKQEDAFSGVIPLHDLEIQSCRSSGPGGQHVNKVNTKVEVRFNVNKAEWIPDWIKPKLLEQQQNRINKNGELIVTSEKTRKQILNQADCLDKIRNMVFQASVKPKELEPWEQEQIKQREEAAKQRSMEERRRRSLLKLKRNGDFL
ncbi:peptidyl-tRNA hydrolase ICT1, mitochondrial-like [Dreissena polymorpha]|uniref:Large ribosomal subunit protein mL62 n=1 Tax=Dreissena polymorpha TaxID=45954 RepID=A0A9D4I445_DREPO|nr:peptidyl-tRNA hydrolase ICT1, mitochondrial-like [Dreissena polymorpha]KAH3747399.1 hypothetical protein DPMN_181824 [Dreissena polymorpha]